MLHPGGNGEPDDVGTSRPPGARRVKIHSKTRKVEPNLAPRRVGILYIAKKGGANLGAQEGEIFFSSFEMGEPSLAPRRVKICPPGAKLGSRRVKYFFQDLKWGSQVWLPGG